MTETTKERNVYLKCQCPMCGGHTIVAVAKEDLKTFTQPDRPYIQDIFPYLPPAEREALMTGICDKCWKEMYGGEDDE